MLALLPLLLLAACGAPHRTETAVARTNPPEPVGQSSDAAVVELTPGGTAPVGGSGATVTFLRVADDSRCPTGVTCVWEGDATVELRVVRPGEPDQTLRLHVNPGPSQSGIVDRVRITLERLEPRPTAEGPVPAAAYRATLALSPAGGSGALVSARLK